MLRFNDGTVDGDTDGASHDGKIKIASKLLLDVDTTLTSIEDDVTEKSSLTDILPFQTFEPDPVGTKVTVCPTIES